MFVSVRRFYLFLITLSFFVCSAVQAASFKFSGKSQSVSELASSLIKMIDESIDEEKYLAFTSSLGGLEIPKDVLVENQEFVTAFIEGPDVKDGKLEGIQKKKGFDNKFKQAALQAFFNKISESVSKGVLSQLKAFKCCLVDVIYALDLSFEAESSKIKADTSLEKILDSEIKILVSLETEFDKHLETVFSDNKSEGKKSINKVLEKISKSAGEKDSFSMDIWINRIDLLKSAEEFKYFASYIYDYYTRKTFKIVKNSKSLWNGRFQFLKRIGISLLNQELSILSKEKQQINVNFLHWIYWINFKIKDLQAKTKIPEISASDTIVTIAQNIKNIFSELEKNSDLKKMLQEIKKIDQKEINRGQKFSLILNLNSWVQNVCKKEPFTFDISHLVSLIETAEYLFTKLMKKNPSYRWNLNLLESVSIFALKIFKGSEAKKIEDNKTYIQNFFQKFNSSFDIVLEKIDLNVGFAGKRLNRVKQITSIQATLSEIAEIKELSGYSEKISKNVELVKGTIKKTKLSFFGRGQLNMEAVDALDIALINKMMEYAASASGSGDLKAFAEFVRKKIVELLKDPVEKIEKASALKSFTLISQKFSSLRGLIKKCNLTGENFSDLDTFQEQFAGKIDDKEMSLDIVGGVLWDQLDALRTSNLTLPEDKEKKLDFLAQQKTLVLKRLEFLIQQIYLTDDEEKALRVAQQVKQFIDFTAEKKDDEKDDEKDEEDDFKDQNDQAIALAKDDLSLVLLSYVSQEKLKSVVTTLNLPLSPDVTERLKVSDSLVIRLFQLKGRLGILKKRVVKLRDGLSAVAEKLVPLREKLEELREVCEEDL